MNIDQLIVEYGIQHVFHFTDVRNLPSIRVHGLLSWRELQRRGIQPIVPGGNDWSHEADERKDLDAYVHLCFLDQHPMEYRAREEGRMIDTAFLQISSEGLRSKNVLFTSDVSNKAGVSPIAVKEAASQLDLDVLYRRHDWRQRDIQARRNAAKKYELLVREAIPIEFITFPK